MIENAFPNGRPALEKGGLMFTERGMVDKVEKLRFPTGIVMGIRTFKKFSLN